MRAYLPPTNDEERLFAKQIAQLVKASQYDGKARATMFLSDRQQDIAAAIFSRDNFQQFIFTGGYDQAQRRILVLCEEQAKAAARFVCAEVLTKQSSSSLTHRDYLGAFLAIGVKREAIGDIIVKESGAIFFAVPAVARLICDELTSVGRIAVKAQLMAAPPMVEQVEQAPLITANIPSLRLQAMRAEMLKCSRSDAQRLVRAGQVQINHITVNSVHYDICADDIFTVRGYGKYKLCEIGGKSRKDRIFVQFQQF